ncbi:MAG: hypothetical protein ACFBSG_01120 [Leptolyngbyaceae cyanobacterium]
MPTVMQPVTQRFGGAGAMDCAKAIGTRSPRQAVPTYGKPSTLLKRQKAIRLKLHPWANLYHRG